MTELSPFSPPSTCAGGQVVRLQEGDPDRQTTYSADPAADRPALDRRRGQAGCTWSTWTAPSARRTQPTGKRWRPSWPRPRETGVPVQFGGGLRSLEAIEQALAAGRAAGHPGHRRGRAARAAGRGARPLGAGAHRRQPGCPRRAGAGARLAEATPRSLAADLAGRLAVRRAALAGLHRYRPRRAANRASTWPPPPTWRRPARPACDRLRRRQPPGGCAPGPRRRPGRASSSAGRCTRRDRSAACEELHCQG